MDSPTLTAATTEAAAAAERHWSANRTALAEAQPGFCDALPGVAAGAEFVYGRDGFLTSMEADGRWAGGCSLPRRAALAQLKDLETRNTTACFLAPSHAAHLRVALERLQRQQAIIALVPDAGTLALFLRWDDFSADVAAGRVWFVTGEGWAGQLAELLTNRPGLPTPTAFLRTVATPDAAIDPLITTAQQVIGAENARRAQRIQSILQQDAGGRTAGQRRLCVIAPSGFRLWELAADALLEVTRTCDRIVFDPDRPVSASPLALAEAVAGSEAVVAANVGRADAVGLARHDVPWITWLTQPRIPSPAAAGPNDKLLVADPAWMELARQAGWSMERVHAAAWPVRTELARPAGGDLALIGDTLAVEVAPDHFEMSSHSLLWESIRLRLLENPFDLDEDPGRYLARWMKRCNVSPDGLDQAAFIDRLIVPVYQQSLVRFLVRSGIAVRVYGAGWDALAEPAGQYGGAVRSREAFVAAIAGARGLVHAWPLRYVHPAEAVGRPVVRSAGRHRESFLNDARLAAKGQLPLPTPAASQALSAELIGRLIA